MKRIIIPHKMTTTKLILKINQQISMIHLTMILPPRKMTNLILKINQQISMIHLTMILPPRKMTNLILKFNQQLLKIPKKKIV